MPRLHQPILILSTLLGSWLGMQAVHEVGHVIGTWCSGGSVVRVMLPVFGFSRTAVARAPHPLVMVWAGPMLGVVIPLLIWSVVVLARKYAAIPEILSGLGPGAGARFFAGFCLVGNGLYIGVGSFDHIGDCDVMLKCGSSLWQLWLFGLLTVPTGFWLWHRQGQHFGFGIAKGKVSVGATYVSLSVCVLLVVVSLIVGG